MDSVKTKSNNYILVKDKAIAGVVLVADKEGFTTFVAWEWEGMAKNNFFAIAKLKFISLTMENINRVADYGTDVTHDPEAQKLFPLLF